MELIIFIGSAAVWHNFGQRDEKTESKISLARLYVTNRTQVSWKNSSHHALGPAIARLREHVPLTLPSETIAGTDEETVVMR